MIVPTRQSCTYCGLPVTSVPTTGGSLERPEDALQPVYCCYGCRLAAAVAAEMGDPQQAHWTLTRLGLGIFFSMNVMVFTLVSWSWTVYPDASLEGARAALLLELCRYASLLFTAPVLILLGGPLLDAAWLDVRRGKATTDLLIAAGVVAAFVYSILSVWLHHPHVYFEVTCAVLVALTLGRWLEATGKQRTTAALRSLEKLLPDNVRVLAPPQRAVTDDGAAGAGESEAATTESTVPLETVHVGSLIRVLAGERIPLDGVVRQGQAAVDEHMISGESEPVDKSAGDPVFAGSLNTDGELLVEVTAPPREGALRRIMDAVEQAVLSKSPAQEFAARVAASFVPAVAILAVAGGVFHAVHTSWADGLMTGLSVLLIACPCALGIATPMAVHAGIGRAARHGIVFRRGDVLESLARARVVCFDKTGTLTTGEPRVDQLITLPSVSRQQVEQVAWALASTTRHVLAEAICRAVAGSARVPPRIVHDARLIPGRGVLGQGEASYGTCYLGSARYAADAGFDLSAALQEAVDQAFRAGAPTVCVGWNHRVQGVFVFRESLRDGATRILHTLTAQGMHAELLTGDHETRVVRELRANGIPARTGLLPSDKQEAINGLRAERGIVVMVGDGVNDAPALASADVGIAMGCGADISREAADVCLLGNDLARIPWLFDLARQTVRTIRHNLAWAFAYNTIGVGLALSGQLNPIWASVAMVGSSLFVITNSLGLSADPVVTP